EGRGEQRTRATGRLNRGASRAIPVPVARPSAGASRSHMIRFLFRFLGFLFLAGGFIALVYDGTKSIAGSAFVYTPLGQIWTNIHSKSLQLLQRAIVRHVAQWLGDPGVLNILTAPGWLLFGIRCAILMRSGRSNRPLIDYRPH